MTSKDAEKAWRKWLRTHPDIMDDEHQAFLDGFEAGVESAASSGK